MTESSDNLLNHILAKNPGMPREELLSLIERKKQESHGLLSDEGATRLHGGDRRERTARKRVQAPSCTWLHQAGTCGGSRVSPWISKQHRGLEQNLSDRTRTQLGRIP